MVDASEYANASLEQDSNVRHYNWVSFVTTDEFAVRVTKITSRIGVS